MLIEGRHVEDVGIPIVSIKVGRGIRMIGGVGIVEGLTIQEATNEVVETMATRMMKTHTKSEPVQEVETVEIVEEATTEVAEAVETVMMKYSIILMAKNQVLTSAANKKH